MHDPMIVAFGIRRPWPTRSALPLGHKGRRWKISGAFWTVGGRHIYWPEMITVWHVEPGDRDSGTVCVHHRQLPDGTWEPDGSWRWHVHHWRLQIHLLQDLRRWLLTRCAWCGGPSRNGSRVNVSHSWDGPRAPWWRGEPGLFHMDCSWAEHAAHSCTCTAPVLEHDGWGRCARCGLFCRYGRTSGETARLRLLKRCPSRTRPSPLLIAEARAMATAERSETP